MKPMVALWGSIVLGGCAQLLLKRALRHPPESIIAYTFNWWLGLLRSGWIWAWIASFTAATGLWLLALSRIDISYAFPLLSASYVLVAVLSKLLLHESVSRDRWAAIGLICLGVLLIARS